MRRTTLPILPIEIVELALDCLRGDSKTLAVCCRVCRVWARRARYNLFYEVKLDSDTIAPFFYAVHCDPRAAAMIRELTLFDLWDDRPTLRPLQYLRTTNLRTLRLHMVDMRDDWLPGVMLHARLSITELQMQTCHVPNAPALVAFLQLMPRLKHFNLSTMKACALTEDADLQKVTGGLPALQSLCLSGYLGASLRAIGALASYQDGFEELRVFKIKLYARDFPGLNSVLGSMAGSLRELDLTVDLDSGRFNSGQAATPLSLAACRNLSVLTLDVRLASMHSPQGGHLVWLPRLFESIRSEEVRLITLVVHASDANSSELSQLDCSTIGNVLRQPRFASLRRVVVKVVRGRSIWNIVGPYVRTRMPALEEKGVLRIVLMDEIPRGGRWYMVKMDYSP